MFPRSSATERRSPFLSRWPKNNLIDAGTRRLRDGVEDGGGDIFWLQRLNLGHSFQKVGFHRRIGDVILQFRRDDAGLDHGDADFLAVDLSPQQFGESNDSEFCRGITARIRVGDAPRREAILTICAAGLRAIKGRAARVISMTPSRLISIIRRQSCGSASATGDSNMTPALFTRMSSRPCRSRKNSMVDRISASRVTSKRTALAAPSLDRILSTSFCSLSVRRAATTT